MNQNGIFSVTAFNQNGISNLTALHQNGIFGVTAFNQNGILNVTALHQNGISNVTAFNQNVTSNGSAMRLALFEFYFNSNNVSLSPTEPYVGGLDQVSISGLTRTFINRDCASRIAVLSIRRGTGVAKHLLIQTPYTGEGIQAERVEDKGTELCCHQVRVGRYCG